MSDSDISRIASPSQIPLASYGVIEVSGADARSFLHGQLSNDILHLPKNGAQWTAYCSAKGRMLAGFLAWAPAPDTILLACDRALVTPLVKRLRMFVLRAKVTVEDASERLSMAGQIGAATGPEPFTHSRVADTTLLGLPDALGVRRTLVVSDSAVANAPAADENEWARLMILMGEIWLTPATQDQFVPQMVNFDVIGGINFKKGCYPGQEVVARAHYRGAVKRRMYRATVNAPAAAGQALFTGGPDGQECGLVANAALTSTVAGSEVLAVVPIQARLESAIHLGAPDGPLLTFMDLPYAIPEAP